MRLVHAAVARVGQQRVRARREKRRVVVEALAPEVIGVDRLEREAQAAIGGGAPSRGGAHRAAFGDRGITALLDAVVARAQLEGQAAAREGFAETEGTLHLRGARLTARHV